MTINLVVVPRGRSKHVANVTETLFYRKLVHVQDVRTAGLLRCERKRHRCIL